MFWKDITSYAQGTKDRTPRTWELRTDKLTIVVTRHLYYGPDVWTVVTKDGLDLPRLELKSKDIVEAREEAIAYVRTELTGMLESLEWKTDVRFEDVK